MGNIYENSYVTISATSSSDGSVRCLRDRERPVKLAYPGSAAIDAEIRAARVEDHHPHGKDDKPAELLGPLTTRAWALQEHVLSTRILHYTRTELLFECRTSFRCECSPSRKSRLTTPALIPKALSAIDKHPSAIWDAWHRVVEKYSRRDLTIQTDKLPAVSGIAGKIQKATSSKYLAGLWEDNFAFDLLWSTSTIALPDARYFALDTYRAPTFSWASLDTPVAYSAFNHDDRESAVPSITLVSSSASINGLNPLGTLRDASVCVLGPILHATLLSTQRDGMWEYVLHVKGTSTITIQHDCVLAEDSVVGTASIPEKTVRRAQCGDVPRKFKAPVVCLGVVRFDTWISGLVLGTARQESCWNRLGTFAAGTDVFLRAREEEIRIV